MRTKNNKTGDWIRQNRWLWAFTASVVIWIIICIISGRIALDTLMINITISSFLILTALGQMVVITSGNGAIDLSMPYVITLSAYIMSYFTGDGGSILLGLVVSLAICMVIGLIIGVIIVKLRVPPIITSLAVGYMVYTAALKLQRIPMGNPNEVWGGFAKYNFHGISTLIIISLIICAIVAFIMYRTSFGKKVHAIGQGIQASELSGVPVKRIRVVAFMMSALASGITGVLLCGYSSGAFLNMGNAYALTPIAAVVVGGTLISGGKSSVVGSIGGALFLTLLVSLMTLSNLSPGIRYLIQGLIFILILVASETKKKN